MNVYSTADWFAQEEESRGSTVLALLSLLGGSSLALFGASRKSLSGAALAAGGGYLVYRGVRDLRNGAPQSIEVEKSLTILKSPEELYGFWSDFENLPKFMRHLRQVQRIDERRSRWTTHAPLGKTLTWEAEITHETPNQIIAWRSLPDSDIENMGSISFTPAPAGRGTEVKVSLLYNPPGGRLGHTFATIFGRDAEQQVLEDLRRFKQLMECGEIPTTIGQPHGPRGASGRIMEFMYREMPHQQRRPGHRVPA